MRKTLMFCWLLVWPAAAMGADTNSRDAGAATETERSALASFGAVFQDNCAVCHGEHMQGAAQGTPLVGVDLLHGDSMQAITASISRGYPERGMPAWVDLFTREQIQSLALWIVEHRDGLLYSEFNITSELIIPQATLHTEIHDFRLEVVADGLDPLPYSIAVLPDGRLLLTEKMRGLRILSPNGVKSELVAGTPTVYDDARTGGGGLEYGMGWLMDVAVHPQYASNGWVYLHHSDRCQDCNQVSRDLQRPVSMNRLIRGRIRDGQWVDEQVLWQADIAHYTPFTDVAAGGRIAFDPDGFVFFSVGMKSMDGIQDLASPHGKIHRLHDDGRVPTDNPFVDVPGADKTVWTYGHRSPQGLEFDPVSRRLWGTEHGPRGGDEVNLLLPGRNYGWPLYSLGQNYDGTKVAWGKAQGVEIELEDIEQPVVDLTPSPAVSSFVIYDGESFPGWRGDFVVGSLKAADVYRMRFAEGRLVAREMLIENLARIRDLEVGPAGELYLLLEHASGGQVVRVVPTAAQSH